MDRAASLLQGVLLKKSSRERFQPVIMVQPEACDVVDNDGVFLLNAPERGGVLSPITVLLNWAPRLN